MLTKLKIPFVPMLLVFLAMVLPRQLSAQTDEKKPMLDLALGADAVFGFWSTMCDVSSDWVGCQTSVFMPELKLGAQYRKGRFGIGGLGSFGLLENLQTVRAFMWRAALDGRYYTPIGKVVDQWYSIELGMVGAHSQSKVMSACCGPVADPEHRLGPEVGAGVGFDFKMGSRFALGLSIRALWLIFLGPTDEDEAKALQLNKTIWFLGGIHARFSFPV